MCCDVIQIQNINSYPFYHSTGLLILNQIVNEIGSIIKYENHSDGIILSTLIYSKIESSDLRFIVLIFLVLTSGP